LNKNIKYILLALVFVLFMGGAYFAYDKLSEKYKTENNTDNIENNENIDSDTEKEETVQAPDFTVFDYNGNSVNLSDFFGKPIVINFWATWCGPCKMELPDFNTLAEEYKDEVVFMMVNTEGGRNTTEEIKAFIEDSGYTFPVYFDTEYSAYYTYGLTSIPRSLFIKPSGEINFAFIGVMDEEFIRKNIEEILK